MNTEYRKLNRRARIYIWVATAAVMLAGISLAIDRAFAHGGESHGPTFQVGTATDLVSISAEARAALNIRTALAEERSVSAGTRVPGVVRPAPEKEALVTSSAAGVITALFIKPGDRVRKGQVLATVASADLGRARGEATSASGDVYYAAANLARQEKLFVRGIVSQRDVDEAAASLSRADGSLSGANSVVSAVGGGRVVSPIDGIVADRPATLGQAVDMGTLIAHIVDPSSVIVEGDVPEARGGILKSGGMIRINTEAFPDKTFEGRISFISPIVHDEKRAIHIIAEITNAQSMLRPGMFVQVNIETESAPSAVAVPVRAVVDEGAERYIFVEQADGQYNRVRVSLGPSDGQWVAVTGPVFAGDKVVVDGTRVLEMAALTGGGKKPEAANPEEQPHSH